MAFIGADAGVAQEDAFQIEVVVVNNVGVVVLLYYVL